MDQPQGPYSFEGEGQRRLTISLGAQGEVSLTGPLHNLVLCLDLLAAAEQALKSHARQAQRGGVVVPAPAAVDRINRSH